MPGVLDSEITYDCPMRISGINVNASGDQFAPTQWVPVNAFGAALALVFDKATRVRGQRNVDVSAGQETVENFRAVKVASKLQVEIKGRRSDYVTGRLENIIQSYLYFRVWIFIAGVWEQYDVTLDGDNPRNITDPVNLTLNFVESISA